MKKRVAVAMSGGVDSSVAAALLKKEGYEVIGVTMCFSLPNPGTGRPGCCGSSGIADARRVCEVLDIRHYVLDFGRVMKDKVIADFISEYARGRTPNPCIRCNEFVKFDALLKEALGLGMRFLATGHYARLEKTGRRFMLKKARDRKKDQSYFLYRLTGEQMSRLLFPVGDYTKKNVRKLAQKFKLPVADKPDSQEVCFIPGAIRDFIKARLGAGVKPGKITDSNGVILGTHQGIALYTVGQRNLGVAAGHPIYAARIDARQNRIIAGAREDLLKSRFLVKSAVFPDKELKSEISCKVKIRYLNPEIRAVIEPCGKNIRVSLREPQFAVTPGQSAVFYDRDRVIGGGIIDRVEE
jgi:tRNA-specific 2-thiouridylase